MRDPSLLGICGEGARTPLYVPSAQWLPRDHAHNHACHVAAEAKGISGWLVHRNISTNPNRPNVSPNEYSERMSLTSEFYIWWQTPK